MFKTTIYTLLLTIICLLLPLSGAASPQSQINKPTRERTKSGDKKQADKQDAKADDKKGAKADDKKETKAPAATNATKDDKKDDVTKKNAAAPEEKKQQPQQEAPAPNPADGPFDGIDVSKHQGVINWETLKKNPKIKYVYIKATEGSNLVDENYRTNIQNARKAGFKVGSYHFLSNKSSVATQFQNFANTAHRDEQDLIPVIDVEVCKQWTPQQLRDSLMVFAKMVEDYYGCKPIIYTYETFFKSYLGKAFAHYPIFIAKYPRNPNDKPNIDGVKWIMWQFSEKGRLNGVKGYVDLGRFNTGYSVNDILYRPAKGKPRVSVKDAVDRNKPKPSTVKMTEDPTAKEGTSSKSKSEADKKQEKVNKNAENQKKAEEQKKKAEEQKKKAEQQKKKAEEEKKKKAEEEKKKKDDAAKKRKAEEEKRAKAKAEADAKAKAEADAKAKRKADAKKAREEQAKRKSQGKSTAASLYNKGTSSKMSQSQRNDSIRSAQSVGRKTNKSSADND